MIDRRRQQMMQQQPIMGAPVAAAPMMQFAPPQQQEGQQLDLTPLAGIAQAMGQRQATNLQSREDDRLRRPKGFPANPMQGMQLMEALA